MWEYDQLSEVQLALLDQEIIDLGGDVDADMVRYAREALLRLVARGSPEITVKITSGGGDVRIGLDIVDLLNAYPGKKIGQVFGFAKSMAAIILQACDVRQCSRHGVVLIHYVSLRQVNLDQLRDAKKVEEMVIEMTKSQERINAILMARTKKSADEINTANKAEKDFSAEEALAFGLIDEIIGDTTVQ